MNTTNAIYRFNDEEQKAELTFLKNKLTIYLPETGRSIYWYYSEVIRDNVYEFRYTQYPPQLIRVSASNVGDELEQRIRKGKLQPNIGKVAPLVKVLIGFLLFIVLAYFLIVPWLASALASRFPVSYEKSIGDQAYESMKSGFVIDTKKTELVNQFFSQLNIPSKYNIQITVVKDKMMNAFAMPGGHIVVYDQLLLRMNSYEELAAVLSHEFTHVENRHTVRTLFRQLGSRIFLSLILGDATAVGSVIINNADNLKSLSYSRSLETEADENGVRLLADRKIDCAGFVRLFQLLKKETASTENQEWMSSHPDLDKRIKGINKSPFCKNNSPQKDSTLQRLFLLAQTED